MQIIIVEGARGVGKSTVTRELRDRLTETILINPTAINSDSADTCKKMLSHYSSNLKMLEDEIFYGTPFNYLYDRHVFSEMVYSSLYKSYDFRPEFKYVLEKLDRLAKTVAVKVIHLTCDGETLVRNLQREGKAELFGDEELKDSSLESINQQVRYREIMTASKYITTNIDFTELDVTGKTVEEVADELELIIKE